MKKVLSTILVISILIGIMGVNVSAVVGVKWFYIKMEFWLNI